MTRPMPGPPEHDLDTRDHDGSPDEWCRVCYYTHLPDCWAPPPKRLTDSECAAEYWRAAFNRCAAGHSRDLAFMADRQRHVDTWHRFAAHPHALEEA